MLAVAFPSSRMLRCFVAILLSAVIGSDLSRSVSADSPGIRILEEIQSVITELAEQAKPSVVNLFPVPRAVGFAKDQASVRRMRQAPVRA